MARNIPKPDVALKNFFNDNDVYAALFNGYFFQKKKVIKAEELEEKNVAYAETVCLAKGKRIKIRKKEKITKYRDNIRKTSMGYLMILGIEDQNKVHYAMPIRCSLYDQLEYSAELSEKIKIEDLREWTIDEKLSKVKKETKVTPIITVVFYSGEEPWDGPKCLHDMMDLDEKIKPLVPDYPLYVIDIGHDKELSFDNRKLEELKSILTSIYDRTVEKNEMVVSKSMVALAGILSGDQELYETALEAKEELKMCKAQEEAYKKVEAKKEAEFAEERAKKEAEFAEERAKKEAEFAEERARMNAKHAEEQAKKDAEIEALRLQLAQLAGK